MGSPSRGRRRGKRLRFGRFRCMGRVGHGRTSGKRRRAVGDDIERIEEVRPSYPPRRVPAMPSMIKFWRVGLRCGRMAEKRCVAGRGEGVIVGFEEVRAASQAHGEADFRRTLRGWFAPSGLMSKFFAGFFRTAHSRNRWTGGRTSHPNRRGKCYTTTQRRQTDASPQDARLPPSLQWFSPRVSLF